MATITVTRYFHRDHLGSTTAITDDAGAVVERLGYEPYGNRRFPNGATDPNNTIVALTTTPRRLGNMMPNAENNSSLAPLIVGRLQAEDIGRNIVGFNVNYDPTNNCVLCENFFRQGSPLSKALNAVPGINAIGGLDDYLNNRAPTSLGESVWFKAVTIPSAVAVTISALLDRVPVYRPLNPFGRN